MGKKTRVHPGRNAKRKFISNQYFDKDKAEEFTSKSAEKLKQSKDSTFQVTTVPTAGYVILSFVFVFSALEQYLKCKVCNGNISFAKYGEYGLGFKLRLTCECGEKDIISCPTISSGYEINRRLVFVMRLLGVGISGIGMFCSLMDLGHGIHNNAYYKIVNSMTIAVNAVFDLVTKKAVNEEKVVHKKKGLPQDILTVSGDGSWSKRGFSSLIGIVSLILKFTGKICDVTIRSSYCYECARRKGQENTVEYLAWFEEHKPYCIANHSGSSGKMEVDGVVEMFLRSIEKFAVRYGSYIGDGDSKTFKMLLDCHPYGEDFIVKKLECILHVAKRIFKRANEARKVLIQKKKIQKKNTESLKKKKIIKTVAKTVGKRKTAVVKKAPKVKTKNLTIKLMKELSENYGLAVRRNMNSLEDMRNEIWAGYYHKISTDAKPKHSKCSIDWCKYLKAKALKQEYKHPPALSKDVQEVLKPIYEDLTKTELLERCLGGHTQNNNESFNNCVWNMAPKHMFNGKKVVEIACKISACIFNEGFRTVMKIMETMGMKLGPGAVDFAKRRDDRRIEYANRRSSECSKDARSKWKKARLEEIEEYEQEEGLLYGPGIAD